MSDSAYPFRKLLPFVFIAGTGASCATMAGHRSGEPSQMTDEAVVHELQRRYFDARVRRDTAYFHSALAPGFTMVTAGDGRHWTRQAALEYLGHLNYDSVQTDSVSVTLHGSTGVASAVVSVWGRNRAGRLIVGPNGYPPGRYRSMLVFAKANGRWWLLASQGTLVY